MSGARSDGGEETVCAIHQVLDVIETFHVSRSCVVLKIYRTATDDQFVAIFAGRAKQP